MRNVLHFARTGQGKGICAAYRLYELGKRCKWIEKHLGVVRYIYLNYHLNENHDWFKRYGKYVRYWENPKELTQVRDSDIFIDEIGSIFPCDGWRDTPKSVRKFFTHFRKRGCEIFAFTQDYGMVDINYRRIVNIVYQSFKVIGSPDISATMPVVKFPWGVIAMYELDVEGLHRDNELERVGFPQFRFIRKRYCNMYNTREEIKVVEDNLLKHSVKFCELGDKCIDPKTGHPFYKVIHS